jgi:flagellar basal body-associated protein FliL
MRARSNSRRKVRAKRKRRNILMLILLGAMMVLTALAGVWLGVHYHD